MSRAVPNAVPMLFDEAVRANDFRFFPAFGGCRAQQRATPIYRTLIQAYNLIRLAADLERPPRILEQPPDFPSAPELRPAWTLYAGRRQVTR